MVKMRISYGSKREPCKIIFTIDDGECRKPRFRNCEVCIGYDVRTGEWHGDELNDQGYIELKPDEIKWFVDRYALEEAVKSRM